MPVFERGEGFGVASMGILLLLVVMREGVSLVLELPSTHEAILGGFEADETELFLQLCCSQLFQNWVGNAPTAGAKAFEGFFLWRWKVWGERGRCVISGGRDMLSGQY